MAYKTPYDFYSPGVIDPDDARAINAARSLAPSLFATSKPLSADEIWSQELESQRNELVLDNARSDANYENELADEISADMPLEDVLKTTARVAAKYGKGDRVAESIKSLSALEKKKEIDYRTEKGGVFYIDENGRKVWTAPPQRSENSNTPKYTKTYPEEIGFRKTGKIIGITRDGTTEYLPDPSTPNAPTTPSSPSNSGGKSIDDKIARIRRRAAEAEARMKGQR